MIKITPHIAVDEAEISFTFMRAAGPGGQNVNKVATAVHLSFDVKHSPSLPEALRLRLISLAGKKVTLSGKLIIKANRHRTQISNKQDALNRFKELLKRAAVPPKKRRKTKPTRASIERRLTTKKLHAKTKGLRRERLKPPSNNVD